MSSESSKQTQKAPALEFRGGVYTSLVPVSFVCSRIIRTGNLQRCNCRRLLARRHRLYYHRYVAL